jgi:hypothetical protein
MRIRVTAMTRRVLLIVALAGLAIRLAVFVADVGQTSLQMDLSSFYAAGQAVDAGLSPYVNHVANDPPIWDGVDRYRHSRFLYPPLAARVFQPMSWIGYHTVKFLWMLASLVAVAAAVGIAIKRTVGLSLDRVLIAAAIEFGPRKKQFGRCDRRALVRVRVNCSGNRKSRRHLAAENYSRQQDATATLNSYAL